MQQNIKRWRIILLVITIIKTVYLGGHMLVLLLNVVNLHYTTQNNLDFDDNHDGDEFIQYNKCKREHKY